MTTVRSFFLNTCRYALQLRPSAASRLSLRNVLRKRRVTVIKNTLNTLMLHSTRLHYDRSAYPVCRVQKVSLTD